MKYSVLLSNDDIDIEQYQKLTEAGASVPYDSRGSNYYIYLPENIEPKTIRHIVSFQLTNMFVEQSEVDKHLNKIETTTQYNVGEKVFLYEIYRNLPMTVTKILDNEHVRVEAELSGKVIQADVQNKFLEPAEEYYDYNLKPPYENPKKLLIDCDYIQPNTDNRITYIHSLILLLIRIKSSYPRYTVIVLNPDDITLFVAQLFGLMVAYGDKRAVAEKYDDSIYFGYDLTMLEYIDSIIYINDKNYIDTFDEKHLNKYCTQENLEYLYQNYNGKNTVNIKSSLTAQPKALGTYNLYHNYDNIDYKRITETLILVGLQTYASAVQNLIKDLHQ